MRREVAARIFAQAAEFMIKHEEFTVGQCLHAAIWMDLFLYGYDGDDSALVDIMGKSPIQTVRSLLQ